jgi:hypothetical protein
MILGHLNCQFPSIVHVPNIVIAVEVIVPKIVQVECMRMCIFAVDCIQLALDPIHVPDTSDVVKFVRIVQI